MGYSLYDVLSKGDLQKDPEFSNALVWTQKIKDANVMKYKMKLKEEHLRIIESYEKFYIKRRELNCYFIQFYDQIKHDAAS